MKRITIGIVLLAFLAAPLHAQQDKKDDDNELLRQYKERQKENIEIDKKYQKTLDQTRVDSAPVKVDPWAKMRGTDDAKSSDAKSKQ
jgi:Ni/Co efflux regulator RcnB